MTRNTENTIISLLRGMDKRMDDMDERFDRIDKTLAEHTKLHKEHQARFKQIIDGIAPELVARTEQGFVLDDHEKHITTLEAA